MGAPFCGSRQIDRKSRCPVHEKLLQWTITTTKGSGKKSTITAELSICCLRELWRNPSELVRILVPSIPGPIYRARNNVLTISDNEEKRWYPRPELNRNQRFRKPLLYPFELRGQRGSELRAIVYHQSLPISTGKMRPFTFFGKVGLAYLLV
jgi:hypothetical protein